MRNLVRVQDVIHSLQLSDESGAELRGIAEEQRIVSMACNQALGKLYLLSAAGLLLCFENHDGLLWKYSTQLLFEGVREHWTTVDFVAVTNTVVCLSREGSIACIEEDSATGVPAEAEQIGVIEGGIAAAAWHPDYSCLVLLTHSHTLLCMSSAWDVLNEVSFPPHLTEAPCDLSWKGDGALLSVLSTDREDSLAKVRVLNPQLEVLAVSRNVGEGPAAVMKNIGGCLAFSTHGVYIAVHQRKPGGQGDVVALLEKNGLRHGDFDIRTPVEAPGFLPWEITSLEWDLPSTLLAVSMRSSPADNSSSFTGCVQLYYRENYHWYLKQQWVERDLVSLGFDAELGNRLYLSQRTSDGAAALRVVDLHWSMSRSDTRDSSVCVCDGEKLLLTPLGYSVVPPPMSLSQLSLKEMRAAWASPCATETTFWSRARRDSSSPSSSSSSAWGMISLVNERGDCAIMFGDSRGFVQRQWTFSLQETIAHLLESKKNGGNDEENEAASAELLQTLQKIHFRSVLVTEGTDGNMVVHLVGSKELAHNISVAPTPLQYANNNNGNDNQMNTAIVAEDVILSLFADALALEDASVTLSAPLSPQSEEQRKCAGVFRAMRVLDGLSGPVYHTTHIFNTQHDIAVGVANSLSGDFEIVRLSFADWHWEHADEQVLLWLHHTPTPHRHHTISSSSRRFDYTESDESVIATIPEISPLFTVVCNAQAIEEERAVIARENATEEEGNEDNGENNKKKTVAPPQTPMKIEGLDNEIKPFTVIALSQRNRLYCSDVLLVAGASSYAFSHSFNLLMFVTLGTKPHLHFASLSMLQRLNALQGEELPLFECAEPRPVERGARLVTAVDGDSRVVIQLPRGNLECFEPRPMILLKAQRLLANKQLLECLVLLRRQRVDLNYLVDFNPRVFMDCVPSFVAEALRAKNADLLSLFITSLEVQDVSVSKYTYFDKSMLAQRLQRREYITGNTFTGDNKVNRACEALRGALLHALQEEKQAQAMNPLLCTFAKQTPPLLVEALKLIKSCSSAHSSNAVSVSQTAAIKYLAFLAEGEKLFEAALGVCDFDTARAIARQCQMDPKAYLPLLESFESIGRGFTERETHSQTLLMHYRVNVHLQRWSTATEFWFKLLRAIHDEEFSLSHAETPATERERVGKMLETARNLSHSALETIKKENLFSLALLRINALEKDCRATLYVSSSSAAACALLVEFISSLRRAFAERALSESQYATAINAFLSTTPPCAEQAVQAALQQGDWLVALSIAGRFHALEKKENEALNPVAIAGEIVHTFKSNQEFANFATSALDDDDAQVLSLESALDSKNNDNAEGEEDKALLAARISVDYLQDCESAVAILCTAQKWTRAVEVAAQHKRYDLFDEIFPLARSAAKDLVKFLRDRNSKLLSHVTELCTMWTNPSERLTNVASTETDLNAELHAEEAADAVDKDNDDTRSEFSAVTKYSAASVLSSASSIRSGTSTLSILSDVSDKSSLSHASQQSQASKTSFSISGLEHGLLSRGSANSFLGENTRVNANGKIYKRDRTPRRQKRIERSRTKGSGKDVWALRREKVLCQELLHTVVNLKSLAKAVNELCGVLALTAERGDHFLSMDLTSAMQQLVKNVQSNTAPVAPAYPREWLVKRAMLCVAAFQDPKQRLEDKLNKRFRSNVGEGMTMVTREIALSEAETEELVNARTFWQLAKSGIQFWFDSKLAHLQYEEEENQK